MLKITLVMMGNIIDCNSVLEDVDHSTPLLSVSSLHSSSNSSVQAAAHPSLPRGDPLHGGRGAGRGVPQHLRRRGPPQHLSSSPRYRAPPSQCGLLRSPQHWDRARPGRGERSLVRGASQGQVLRLLDQAEGERFY